MRLACACPTAASTWRNSERAHRAGVLLLDERVYSLAVYVLEYQVRLAARAHAGVEQPRDARVREPGEHEPSRRKRA